MRNYFFFLVSMLNFIGSNISQQETSLYHKQKSYIINNNLNRYMRILRWNPNLSVISPDIPTPAYQVWSLPIPCIIRHFAWKACRDILLTKVNLMRRQVLQDNICEECRLEAQTSGHILWMCPKAREVWSCLKIVASISSSRCHSFRDLLWNILMLDRNKMDKVAKVVTIAWSLWCNRNEVRNGGEKKNGMALVHWAIQYLEEYNVAIEVTCNTVP